MPDNTSNVTESKGYLSNISSEFNTGSAALIDELNAEQKKLQADPSNPEVLAKYQAKLQEYTLFRNAQTSTVKAYKDIGAAIIQNFR